MIGAKKQCKYGDNVYVDGDAGDGVVRAPVMMIMLMVVNMAMMELVYRGGSKKRGNFKGKLLVSVRLGAIIRQQW